MEDIYLNQQLWVSKEIKGLMLRVLAHSNVGAIVTFELSRINPKRTYFYTNEYINLYYKYMSDFIIKDDG